MSNAVMAGIGTLPLVVELGGVLDAAPDGGVFAAFIKAAVGTFANGDTATLFGCWPNVASTVAGTFTCCGVLVPLIGTIIGTIDIKTGS